MIQKTILTLLFIVIANGFVIQNDSNNTNFSEYTESDETFDKDKQKEEEAANVFNGVYRECFLYLSYSCLQNKTLLYLKELNKLSEVSVIGEYVKFVKVNESENEDNEAEDSSPIKNSEELSFLIDEAVDKFFNNHVLKFNALGKDLSMSRTVEEFVGRKRKGGGGGGGGHGGGHDDGGKKKMMMMAMMCMKMKLMMMVPAMMGMMGMMSFKGMMFSMMSFMISKMMLLMKILEKKGGGGSGGGGGDGGWAAGGGGGGGAWMPAGGPDYGGGGGGYDANGQWQSRSIPELVPSHTELIPEQNLPIITYVKPTVRYNRVINGKKPFSSLTHINDEIIKLNQKDNVKSRKKRGVIDIIQNAYLYWLNKMLGLNTQKYLPKYPKYRIINGVKYVYYPIRQVQKAKSPKELPDNDIKVNTNEGFKPIVAVEDFNKGEIVEGPVESRSMKKKIKNLKGEMDEALDENPWQ